MRYSTGLVLVLVAGVLWSSMGVVLRQIEGAGVWATLVWRSVGSVLALGLWLAVRGGLAASVARTGLPGVIGGLCLILAFAGSIIAYQTTTIANAVLLFATSPFLAALLGRLFLAEPVRPVTLAAMVLGLAGIFVMVREGLGMGALTGNLAGLVSAAGFAGFSVCVRWGRGIDMTPAVWLGSVFSMLVGLAGVAVAGEALWIGAANIGWGVGLGVVVLSGGMLLYTRGAQVLTAAELTLLSMVEVMLAPLWAFVVLDEAMTPAMLAGGAILMCAVLWNGLDGARSAPRGVATRAAPVND